jgi:hypothetical protein
VAVSPQTSPVPQAVSHIAGVITEIQIIQPVVTRIIIMVADELVPAELPTQDHHHHCAMQHHPAFSYHHA